MNDKTSDKSDPQHSLASAPAVHDELSLLVEKAQQGEKFALEEVIRCIQDQVYHLSMRMLVNPQHAEEATQEILILVVTKLSTFQGNSQFKTWVYRVAVNYLINAKKIQDRELGLTFEAFQQDLHQGLETEAHLHEECRAEDKVLLNELRIACTMAMLLCLDLKHRVAYVLGDILEMEHQEAASILEITPTNYRKRLSRARRDIVDFTSQHCGVVNESAACHCPRRLPAAQRLGRISKHQVFYSTFINDPSDQAYEQVLRETRRLEKDLSVLKLQQSTPHFIVREDLGAWVTQMVERTDITIN